MNHHLPPSSALGKKKNKYEALKLNHFKQLEEQDMVHQRELQQKEHFPRQLKRQEQELREVEERMSCQHEGFQKLLHELCEQLKAEEGESQRRRSSRTKRKPEECGSDECGNGKYGNSGVIIIPFPRLTAYSSNKSEIFFVLFV